MKKKFKYASLVLILALFMGQFAFAQDSATPVTTSTEGNKQMPSPDMRPAKDRAIEMRQKMDDKLKERQEKRLSNESEAKKIDTVCAQTAIEARDTAIIAAFDTYTTSMKTALEARKNAVKDAWSKATPSERNAARRIANQAYTTASKNAHKTLSTAKRTVWEKYKTDMKACGAGAGIDQMGQVSGGLSL